MFRHKMPMHSSANDGVGSLPEIKFNFVMLFQHLHDEVTRLSPVGACRKFELIGNGYLKN